MLHNDSTKTPNLHDINAHDRWTEPSDHSCMRITLNCARCKVTQVESRNKVFFWAHKAHCARRTNDLLYIEITDIAWHPRCISDLWETTLWFPCTAGLILKERLCVSAAPFCLLFKEPHANSLLFFRFFLSPLHTAHFVLSNYAP